MRPAPCLVLHLPYLTKSLQCNFSKCFNSPYHHCLPGHPSEPELDSPQGSPQPHSVLVPGFFISRYPPTSPSHSHSLSSAKSPVSLPPPLRDASPSCAFLRLAPLRTHFPCCPLKWGWLCSHSPHTTGLRGLTEGVHLSLTVPYHSQIFSFSPS